MELYTSLTRLKMAMNDGSMPPMTELTSRARGFLDPAFVPGMGAIEEHPERGLRCPIRGCGKYFHELSRHISMRHGDIGGTPVIRELLDIPRSVSLTTKRAQERRRLGCYENNAHLRDAANARALGLGRTKAARAVGPITAKMSLACRNLRDRCDAQLRVKLETLKLELNRLPNRAEFIRKYGMATWCHARKLMEFTGHDSSWVTFVRFMGYKGYRRGVAAP